MKPTSRSISSPQALRYDSPSKNTQQNGRHKIADGAQRGLNANGLHRQTETSESCIDSTQETQTTPIKHKDNNLDTARFRPQADQLRSGYTNSRQYEIFDSGKFIHALNTNDSKSINKFLKNKDFDLNAALDEKNNTLLHTLANSNSSDALKRFVHLASSDNRDIDFLKENRKGDTALEIANRKRSELLENLIPEAKQYKDEDTSDERRIAISKTVKQHPYHRFNLAALELERATNEQIKKRGGGAEEYYSKRFIAAVEKKDFDKAKELLERGATPTCHNNYGYPVHEQLARNGMGDELEKLLLIYTEALPQDKINLLEGACRAGLQKAKSMHQTYKTTVESGMASSSDHEAMQHYERTIQVLEEAFGDGVAKKAVKKPEIQSASRIQISRIANKFEVVRRPPIQQLVFSGGGAKGAAYPGVIKALEERGVLETVNEVSGASIGAVIAAYVASGMSADEIRELSNKDYKALLGIRTFNKTNLEATHYETFLREEIRQSVLNRIDEYESQKSQNNSESSSRDSTVMEIYNRLSTGQNKDDIGVTFNDLAMLSQKIPTIKRFSCTATANKNKEKGQLSLLSVDTAADMGIAKAIHASGAFPIVFKQVEHAMSSGETYHFSDGGIMVNTPAAETIDVNDNNPLNRKGRLIFMFQGASTDEVMDEVRNPRSGAIKKAKEKMKNFVVNSDHQSNMHVQKHILNKSKDQVVVMPLRTTDSGDFRNATLNFDMSNMAKAELQRLSEEATKMHLDNKKSNEFKDTFNSLEDLLYALNDEDFELAVSASSAIYNNINSEDIEVIENIKAGRLHCNACLKKLDMAIEFVKAKINDKKLDVSKDGSIYEALHTVENQIKAYGKGMLNYVARKLSDLENKNFQQLLSRIATMKEQEFDFLSAALKESEKPAVKAATLHLLRNVIAPSLIRNSKNSEKQRLLLTTLNLLEQADSKKTFNGFLDSLIKAYMPGKESITVKTAQEYKFKI